MFGGFIKRFTYLEIDIVKIDIGHLISQASDVHHSATCIEKPFL